MNTPNAYRWPAALTLGTLLTLLFAAPTVRAANANPPGKMTFQGFLTDAASPPVPLGNTSPENKTVTFKIYKSATGTVSSDVVWAESQVVTVDKGHFSVLLGEGSAVSGLPHNADLSGVFIGSDASDRWIGITVDGAEITPRIQFFAAPYAQLARFANSIGGSAGDTVLTSSGGNVGIGTTSPTVKLDVNGNVNATGSVTSSGSVAGLIFANRQGGSSWQWYSDNGTARLWNGVDRVAVTSSGNVGIGTSSPADPLQIGGFDKNDQYLSIKSAGGNAYRTGIKFRHFNDTDGFNIESDERSVSDGLNFIRFPFGGTAASAMFIGRYSGNVGIGTTSPDRTLDVEGDITINGKNIYFRGGTDSNHGIGWFGTGKLFANQNLDGPVLFGFSSGALGTMNGGEKAALVWNSSGSVGIGTASPATSLHVNGNARIEGASTLEFGGGVAGKEVNAGKIGYATFTGGALDIVGAGAGGNRVVKLWDHVVIPGSVGIGTDNAAQAKLVVNGAAGNDAVGTHASFVNTGGGGAQAGNFNFGDVSIKGTHAIHALYFRAVSDARIKNIQGRSDGTADLETLNRIEITDYQHKDVASKGNRPQKKVIGQQIEQVFPQAVVHSVDVVPDIYKEAAIQDGWINLATNLKKGDRVRLVSDSQDGVHEVLEATPDKFRTVLDSKDKSVFVYGREVKDFRVVDYEAVAMLNVSATQELARKVEALQESEARIAELEQKTARMAELELKAARVDFLEREVAELKDLVVGFAQKQAQSRPAARRVAAARE